MSAQQPTTPLPTTHAVQVQLPRISIQFCTQCRWMLRAAYFAQELLSSFSTSIGEIALIPSTGGVFIIDITYTHLNLAANPVEQDRSRNGNSQAGILQTARLWDRKEKGGFPETAILKQLVRNIIDPGRDLGHVDKHKESRPHHDNTIFGIDATATGSSGQGSHGGSHGSGDGGGGEVAGEGGGEGGRN